MSSLLRITSKDNKIIKTVSKLQTVGRSRKANGLFVVEGLRLCKDAYLNGFEFEFLVVSDSGYNKHRAEFDDILSSANDSYIVPDDLFLKISDTVSPQGIIGVIKYKNNSDFKADGKYIALENVQDPSNLGAIARSAEAFGITAIVISSNGCDAFSPKALRASMGALLRINVYTVDNVVDFLKMHNIKTYACVVDSAATDIRTITFDSPCAALIGNEGNGLSEYAIGNCDESITIRMSGKAESLNAAMAATVVIWQMTKNS